MKVKLPPGLAPELVQTPFALQLNVFAGDVARVHAPAPVQVQVASSRLHAPLLDPYDTALSELNITVVLEKLNVQLWPELQIAEGG